MRLGRRPLSRISDTGRRRLLLPEVRTNARWHVAAWAWARFAHAWGYTAVAPLPRSPLELHGASLVPRTSALFTGGASLMRLRAAQGFALTSGADAQKQRRRRGRAQAAEESRLILRCASKHCAPRFPATHRLWGKHPDSVESETLRSDPFQQPPENRTTGDHFHSSPLRASDSAEIGQKRQQQCRDHFATVRRSVASLSKCFAASRASHASPRTAQRVLPGIQDTWAVFFGFISLSYRVKLPDRKKTWPVCHLDVKRQDSASPRSHWNARISAVRKHPPPPTGTQDRVLQPSAPVSPVAVCKDPCCPS